MSILHCNGHIGAHDGAGLASVALLWFSLLGRMVTLLVYPGLIESKDVFRAVVDAHLTTLA